MVKRRVVLCDHLALPAIVFAAPPLDVAGRHTMPCSGHPPTAGVLRLCRGCDSRLWHARGLKPRLVDTFKISTDPAFEEKLTDVAGLYSNPIQPSW